MLMSSQSIISPISIQSACNHSSLCPVSTPLCVHIQASLHHLSWACKISTPYNLLTSCQYTISHAHVQSAHHAANLCPISALPLLPVSTPFRLPMFIQNKNLSIHVQSVHHIFCLLLACGMVYLLHMGKLNGALTGHGHERLCSDFTWRAVMVY